MTAIASCDAIEVHDAGVRRCSPIGRPSWPLTRTSRRFLAAIYRLGLPR